MYRIFKIIKNHIHLYKSSKTKILIKNEKMLKNSLEQNNIKFQEKIRIRKIINNFETIKHKLNLSYYFKKYLQKLYDQNY